MSGTDTFIRMRGSKPKDGDRLIFLNKADWEVAQYIADKNGIPIEVTKEGPTHERVVHPKDQSDADFLLELAKRNEFDLYMEPASGTIRFVKPTDGRDGRPIVVYEFAWGQNLIEFSPQLSATDQVSSVTVRGWNPQSKQSIVVHGDGAGFAADRRVGKHGSSVRERRLRRAARRTSSSMPR